MANYEEVVTDILANLDRYHEQFYGQAKFVGPSLYFHRTALSVEESDLERKLEYIYATLVAWGMHRMGSGGAKMVGFHQFRDSVVPEATTINLLRNRLLTDMSMSDWDALKHLFFTISVMASSSHLVGHSKVLAHLLPNIVCPIDRNYTLKHLHSTVPKDIDTEWQRFEEIHKGFVLPIVANKTFQAKAGDWMARQYTYEWDTSFPKIVDNLLIGRNPPP